MKKNVKITIILSALVIVLIIALGVGRNTSLIDFGEIGSVSDVSRWGSSTDISASLGDTGLFYVKNERLTYYDLEHKEKYVLCNRPNCLHSSEKCIAYFQTNIMNKSADNVFQVGKYVYCTYSNITVSNQDDANVEKAVQLLRIDLEKGTRDVIASFPSGYDVEEGSEGFYATNIDSIDYCNGYAWLNLKMQEFDTSGMGKSSYIMHCGVNLQTGDICYLHENDGLNYTITAVCPDSVYYFSRTETYPRLSYEEFIEGYGEKQPELSEGKSFSDYVEYIEWHDVTYVDKYEWFVYRISTGDKISLGNGETELIDGYQKIPYGYYGEYQGKTLCMDERNGDRILYLIDILSGEKQVISSGNNIDMLGIAQGTNTNLIFPDGRIFYFTHSQSDCTFETQDCTADIYVFDCNTGTSEFLFTDHHNITFRIYGQYNGGFIGKHKDYQIGGKTYYWISEEDFYAGNLNEMVRHGL